MDLPDVNVLVALFDPLHVRHDAAQAWFSTAATAGWATCPLTQNGFVRVTCNPAYPGPGLTAMQVAAGLRSLIAAHPAGHRFLADDVSLVDSALFDLTAVQGHQQITDLYLLGLCLRHAAVLVTFDAGIPLLARALVGPATDPVRLLEP